MRNTPRCLFKILAALILFSPVLVSAAQTPPEPYLPGETVTFDIKKLGMKVGEATLVYRGPGRIANRDTVLIEFTSRAINFLDEEKIYLDPVRMVPMVVERNLNIFGKK